MASDTPEDAVLDAEISDIENKMMSYCNLVPVHSWGFDDDVREELRNRKHRMLDNKLSRKQKERMSSSQKQKLARGIGAVPNSVQEVLEWMSTTHFANLEIIKRHTAKPPQKQQQQQKKSGEPDAKKKKLDTKPIKEDDKEEKENSDDSEPDNDDDDDDSEPSEDDDEDDEVVEEEKSIKKESAPSKAKKAADSVAARISIAEADDSSDEEEEDAPTKAQNGGVEDPTIAAQLAKSNQKLDKEIERLQKEISDGGENAELSRQIALLRLQKKLKELKHTRKGKGKARLTPAMAAKMEEERKMKRRMSKLKLKQRRAEQKKGDEPKGGVKEEGGQTNGGEKAKQDDDKMSVSFNKFQFEIKDESSGKHRKRTPKKERPTRLSGKDYKGLLTKVEKTNAVIEKVREADPHKATIMEDELKWEKTMKRAEGVKVKDNVELLKKALRNKNKTKERKKTKWTQRIEKVQQDKGKKKEKRDTNLQKRKDEVKRRKLSKMRKKGRIL